MEFSFIGSLLAVLGSLLGIIGTIVFNQRGNVLAAKKIWALSNPMLLLWAAGFLAGLWNGAISVAAMFCLYAVYTLSNWHGLLNN